MPNIKMKIAQKSDKLAWDQYVLKHPQGIAYHLFAWKEAVEGAYGFEGIYLIAREENSVVGVLPFIHMKSVFFPGRFVSLPYCDTAGPLADSPRIEKELIAYSQKLSGKHNNSTIHFRRAYPQKSGGDALEPHPEKVRMLLALPSNSDQLLNSLKAKVRSQVKKPLRDGLNIQSGGKELLDDFYAIFTQNMRDLGSPVHSKKWLRSILDAYKNRAVLFIVRMPDNIPAAGGILLCHPNMVSVPWASSLRRYNKKNPNMLLYWGFLKFASDNKYPYFDFGRSSVDEGTYRFKKQWGAIPAPLYWFDYKKNNSQKFKIELPKIQSMEGGLNLRSVAENILSRTPVTLTTAFGSFTRRYISL